MKYASMHQAVSLVIVSLMHLEHITSMGNVQVSCVALVQVNCACTVVICMEILEKKTGFLFIRLKKTTDMFKKGGHMATKATVVFSFVCVCVFFCFILFLFVVVVVCSFVLFSF